jgi:hypothetical protein
VHRLSKRQVEAMLDAYDADPVAALTVALQVVLGQPDRSFDELLEIARFPSPRRQALAERDAGALDDLLSELNELRTLDLG